MEGNQRIRIVLPGGFEFEAEGTPESVKEQLAAFQAMVERQPVSQPKTPDESGKGGAEEDGGPPQVSQDSLDRYFHLDRKRKLVTLRIHPQGAQREANASLLILYGFLRLASEEDVLVGRLKDALEQSGIHVCRIDKAVAPHQRGGMVLKGGKPGPGGKYRLSNTGINEAERQIRELT